MVIIQSVEIFWYAYIFLLCDNNAGDNINNKDNHDNYNDNNNNDNYKTIITIIMITTII